ncbi:TonB-dependent receptor [Pedobacter sp. SYSU D00535]|uniref:SusC/RagA family TonB-linked outer membrane protein n=1 Tax=Pedobacter sp. SYSU D00535 TaxID=2810308 RepID=UPI001A97004F|nr:TonB-dependent receptor [Pedobacter sp. SYSU D00535]
MVSCLLTGAIPALAISSPLGVKPVEAIRTADIVVTGKVVDDQGEALIGVSVKVKGTNQGVSTDIDGNFKMTVSENATLVFSYLGYETREIAVNGQKVLRVVLKSAANDLEEVVVVGYGTAKKRDLTGSVGSIDSEAIAARGTTSVMGALQGAVAGVNINTASAKPGASFNIQIRGQNSLNANGARPLFVVDGIVMDNIDWLNPADISKIDVLKDASSTAIYGSRGSSGVVLVSTKGSNVANIDRTSVTYDGFYGVRELTRIPEFLDGRDWVDFRTSNFYTYNAGQQKYELTGPNQTTVLQNSRLLQQRLYDQSYTDWLDLGTKQGAQQNHFVNVNGVSGTTTYNLGIGYQGEKGNFQGEDLDKYNLKLAINSKPSKIVTVGGSVNLGQNILNNGSQNGYQDLFRMAPILAAYDSQGNLIRQPGVAAAIEGAANFTSSGNPLIEIQSGNREIRRFDILGNAFAAITPFPGLEIRSTFMPRLNRTRDGYYYGVTPDRTQSTAFQENEESFEWTLDNLITYRKTLGRDHNINATLINSFYRTRYERARITSNNLPYNSEWYNLGMGTIVQSGTGSYYDETGLISYAGRVNYDYKNKYLVTGTVRFDGSSKLRDKWTAFPSVALAWRANEEEFLKTDWLSDLKARVSFGYSGSNSGIAPFGSMQTPNLTSQNFYDYGSGVVTGAVTGRPVNPFITWEKTRELNYGLDFGFFNQRISGTVDLYDKLSEGLLMSRNLAVESGVANMTDNIGSVSNKGVEVALSTVNIRSKNINWTTSVNFAYNKNRIEKLTGGSMADVSNAWFVGQPINVIYDYKIAGIWRTDQAAEAAARGQQPGQAIPYDVNADGKYNADDRTILGQVDPKWTGNFTSSLNIKNWDFGFNLYGRWGTFVSDNFLGEYSTAANNDRGRPKIAIDYFVPANVPIINWDSWDTSSGSPQVVWGNTGAGNEDAAYPVFRNAGAFWGNNGRYTKADFVKVRNITLGYTFGNAVLARTKLSNLRIYANVLNPFTFTDYKGWDPEYATTSLVNGNGPSTVIYQLGMNVKF